MKHGSTVQVVSGDRSSSSRQGGPQSVRVVLLADDQALRIYGPVLRRMAVGLIDEVQEINLLSLNVSKFLEYVPCPPIRLFTETRQYQSDFSRAEAMAARQIPIQAPHWEWMDRLWPHRRVERLAEALRPFKPTLLHALSENLSWLARRLSKTLDIPYVNSLLAYDRLHISFSASRCTAILPCNSALVRQIRSRFPQLSKRIHLLPIGTHVSESTCCFSASSRRPSIFCCCPYQEHKGLDELIEAVSRLVEKGQDPLVTISGQGPYEMPLRKQVQKHKLSDRIQFVPPIEDVVSLGDAYKVVLRDSDIYIQSRPANTFQIELLEAMSVGNAVAVAEGQENDLILPGKTAQTFAFRSAGAMAEALEGLLSRPQTARELAVNAQNHLRKHFLASQMISCLAEYYRQALEIYPA